MSAPTTPRQPICLQHLLATPEGLRGALRGGSDFFNASADIFDPRPPARRRRAGEPLSSSSADREDEEQKADELVDRVDSMVVDEGVLDEGILLPAQLGWLRTTVRCRL